MYKHSLLVTIETEEKGSEVQEALDHMLRILDFPDGSSCDTNRVDVIPVELDKDEAPTGGNT